MIVNRQNNENLIENVLGSRARVKILKILAKYEELTISLIIKKARLNYTCVLRHLNFLKKINLIQEKNFGRIKIFRFKSENIKARSLKKFIEIWEGDFY
ncbi:MAG: winged helix-turn-helix domain-containing protein [Promethearchaeota archaeon]